MKKKTSTAMMAANLEASGPRPDGGKGKYASRARVDRALVKIGTRNTRAHQRNADDWFWAWNYASLVP